jgi:hypothetical protein
MGKIISKNKIDTTDNTSNIDNIANIVDVDVCAICLNNVKKTNKKTTTMLECNHYYHTECIDVWLSEKNTCPYCMQVTTYKPKAVNEIKKETVINIINNNVQNRNNIRNNNTNTNTNIFNRKIKDNIYVTFSMILIISSIVNIALIAVVANTINDNYINLNNLNLTNTTECVEKNSQENIYISCVPDYIIQSVYILMVFFMPGLFSIKNKYIYFTVIFATFIISYSLNLYRYITFNKYLDIMNNVNYCDNINSNIQVEKIFMLIEIIILGICFTCFMFLNICEYFYRKNNN